MIKACQRHMKAATVLMVRARGLRGAPVEQMTWLCTDCRVQAAQENAAALSRRTISTNIAAYRRAGFAGDLPPELRG